MDAKWLLQVRIKTEHYGDRKPKTENVYIPVPAWLKASDLEADGTVDIRWDMEEIQALTSDREYHECSKDILWARVILNVAGLWKADITAVRNEIHELR